ncbi:MAG TPA: Na+/H+ antiporter [Chryseosolibacter sp.]
MQTIATVIILLAVVTALADVTDRIRIPYPILLVLSGIGIGLIPGLPRVTLNPEVVFLIFLPPILYSAAWNTSWPDFKTAKRPIILLAIGCVIFTTLAVAWIAHRFIPGFGWPEAFVLGAIISPPDAIAATASTKGLAVPKRIITILEGESLVNDATGLIVYRYGIAAVATGAFSLWEAGLRFVVVATAGVVLGLVVARIVKWMHSVTTDNPTIDTTMTFITPFVAYLLAESIHVSGVLAVVSCGIYLNWHSSVIFSHRTRLQAYGSWNTVIFILNGLVFIFIGLQLPVILENIEGHSFVVLLKYGTIVSLAVIVGRIIWVYPGAYLPRLSRRVREREPEVNLRLVTIVAWSGMRGVVSMAAALAIPFMIGTSTPFPNRDLIIFLTFCVIFSTLVLQGLTLRPLIKLLGIQSDGRAHDAELRARVAIASALIEFIEENYSLALTDEGLNLIKTKYEIRIQRIRKGQTQMNVHETLVEKLHPIQQELLNRERELVLKLRNEGAISEESLRKMEYELDLEESRLLLEQGMPS